ncbi:MAG: DUF6671 family protein [Patescibacteria group bacterium]
MQHWQNRTALIATKHGKEAVIGPRLAILGLHYEVTTDFDTDAFGTFTRDIARPGDQLATARAKATAAHDHYGAELVVVSEGSFGSDPAIPFLGRNLELVLLVDFAYQLEIRGEHQAAHPQPHQATAHSVAEARDIATAWGFPEQGIILRRHAQDNRQIIKDIDGFAALDKAIHQLLRPWWRRSLSLETDMRAHRCPERQQNIAAAADDLVAHATRLCPACHFPGWQPAHTIAGLPCAHCTRPTDSVRAWQYACSHCGHTAEQTSEQTVADPGLCAYCNP